MRMEGASEVVDNDDGAPLAQRGLWVPGACQVPGATVLYCRHAPPDKTILLLALLFD